MSFLLKIIKVIIYSNLLVSCSVAAFTHLSFFVLHLPHENALEICAMVFCFTFTTYNGQRIFRLDKYHDLGERLQWVVSNKTALSVFSILTGIIGLVLTLQLELRTFLLLLPTGVLSLFYVVPIPMLKKGLRDMPYLKVFIIAFVWSLIIVGIPYLNNAEFIQLSANFILAFATCFLFILAITLPFDVRDLKYDNRDHLKTFPQFLGIKGTITASQLSLLLSFLAFFLLKLDVIFTIGVGIGYLITAVLISLTSEKRGELFYAGWIESTVLFIWAGGLITHHFLI